MSTQHSIQAITLCSVATELYDACKMLKRAWDQGEDSNEVEWEDLVLAVGMAEESIQKLDALSVRKYCVVMRDQRDRETGEPLFWSTDQQWVSLHEANAFALDEDDEFHDLLIASFPNEAWGFVELPTCERVSFLP